jgi:catechol 2,3-dioxygenase-like lactoylglutathione lyase family enzyme
MMHHASLGTNDLERARTFYDPVLATLGIRLIKSASSVYHRHRGR